MKNTLFAAFLCGIASLAFGQNAVTRSTQSVFLAAAPAGDCRVQFYNQVIDNSFNVWACNFSTGVWTSSATSNVVVAAGKTLTVSNSLTLAGTDATTMTFPTTSATIARTDAAQTFTGIQTFSSAPVIATITNTGTETLPSSTGGIPIVVACGNTTTGSGTCANTAVGATAKVYYGNATLASNAQTVTISPGFTSSSTFQCVGNDQTTRANPVQVVPASGTTFTITNTTGASDVIQWICVGN